MVVEDTDGRFYVAGLVATDLCQNEALPGVYTKVSAFRDWIDVPESKTLYYYMFKI